MIAKEKIRIKNNLELTRKIFFTFRKVIQGVLNTENSYFPKKAKQELLSAIIKECYQIGSSAVALLGTETFLYFTIYLFANKFSISTIKRWFLTMKHLKENASQKAHDEDFRITFLREDLQFAEYLNTQILHQVALTVPEHVGNQFKAKTPHLLKRGFSNQESFLLAQTIRNFTSINKEKTKYGLIAFKTEEEPVDFISVGLNSDFQPTLENPNLSSRYCFGVPQLPFLSANERPKEIEITADPFGVQAVLDFLFLICATPTTCNLDGWRHFLRKCTRMLNLKREIAMLQHVHAIMEKFSLNSGYIPEIEDWSTSPLTNQQILSAEGFLYLVLSKDFEKIEGDCPDLRAEPYYLAGFLFRACQSLSMGFKIDPIAAKLWKWVDELHWDQKKSNGSTPAFSEVIKNAMVKENVPFTVVSVWLCLLIWLWEPHSATIHGGKPVFHLKKLFPCLMPICLMNQIATLQEYLSNYPFPHSFQQMHTLMSEIHAEAPLSPFPLLCHFPQLGLDPETLKKVAWSWIFHSTPVLNVVGLHFYFSFYSLAPDQDLFISIIQNFPTLVQGICHKQQQHEIQECFKLILASYFQCNENLAMQLSDRALEITYEHEWIGELLASNHPKLIETAFTFCNEKCQLHYVDSYLLKKEITDTMLDRPHVYNNLLLNYLDKTYTIQTEKRLKQLWELFQLSAKLYRLQKQNIKSKKNRIPREIKNEEVRLYSLMAHLLRAASLLKSSPPNIILTWIKQFGEPILKELTIHDRYREAEVLFLTIFQRHYVSENLNDLLWLILKNHFIEKQFSISLYCILDKERFKSIITSAKQEEIPALLWQIENLCIQCPERVWDVFEWTLYLFSLNQQKGITLHLEPAEELYLFLQEKVAFLLSNKQLSEKQISLLMDLMKLFNFNTLQNRDHLWERVDHADSLKGRWPDLIERAWREYPPLSAFMPSEDPFLLASCLTHALISLNRIKHQDLKKYLYDDGWLSIYTANSETLSFLKKTLPSLFQGLIQSIEKENPDWELVDKIIEKKNHFYSPNFFPVKRGDKKLVEKMRKVVNFALLDSLLPPKYPLDLCLIKTLSKIITNIIEEDPSDVSQILESGNYLLKGYIHLVGKGFFAQDEENAIKNSLKVLFESLKKCRALSSINLLKLTASITNQELIAHQSLIGPFILSLLPKCHSKEIAHLKSLFFALLIESLSQEKQEYSQTPPAAHLQLALNKLNFSIKEKAELQFLNFKQECGRVISSKPVDEEMVKELTNLYVLTFPKLQPQINFVEDALAVIIPPIITFSKELNSSRSHHFEKFLFDLLEVNNFLKSEDHHSAAILDNYTSIVLKAFNQAPGIDHFLFTKAVECYLQKVIEEVPPSSPLNSRKELFGSYQKNRDYRLFIPS